MNRFIDHKNLYSYSNNYSKVFSILDHILLSKSLLGYEPANLTLHPFKKNVLKGSLYFSNLFRLKDPKTWFLSIFTQTKFW